jgi:hypothetical protein
VPFQEGLQALIPTADLLGKMASAQRSFRPFLDLTIRIVIVSLILSWAHYISKRSLSPLFEINDGSTALPVWDYVEHAGFINDFNNCVSYATGIPLRVRRVIEMNCV